MSWKLNDCLNAPKTYSKILNYFLNNIKIPSIPPLLVNGYIISNFLGKAELFNKLFTSQCSPVNDSRALPPFNLRADKIMIKFPIVKMILPRSSKKSQTNRMVGTLYLLAWLKFVIRLFLIHLNLFFKPRFKKKFFQALEKKPI